MSFLLSSPLLALVELRQSRIVVSPRNKLLLKLLAWFGFTRQKQYSIVFALATTVLKEIITNYQIQKTHLFGVSFLLSSPLLALVELRQSRIVVSPRNKLLLKLLAWFGFTRQKQYSIVFALATTVLKEIITNYQIQKTYLFGVSFLLCSALLALVELRQSRIEVLVYFYIIL